MLLHINDRPHDLKTDIWELLLMIECIFPNEHYIFWMVSDVVYLRTIWKLKKKKQFPYYE